MRRLMCGLMLTCLAACNGADTGGGGDGTNVGFAKGITYSSSGDIWVADSSDFENKAQKLTSDGNNGQPAISRDGKSVAWVHVDGSANTAEILEVPAAGGTASTLVAAGAHNYAGLAWSADGSKLFFAMDSAIFSVNSDGSATAAVSQSSDSFSAPSVATDGTLFALDSTLGAFVNVTTNAAIFSAPTAARGAISPSGSQLAYEDSSAHEIFVFDSQGAAPRQLTSISGSQQSQPCWSSDGATIFFVSNAGGEDKIYSVAASASMSSGTLVQVGDAPSYGG